MNTTAEKSRPEGGARLTLRSLAPEYLPDHSGYVQHLEDAIQDPKNRNIALTGRYGSGKSSVLDQFESSHASKTLRISINTLGPDEDDDDLTNRIQKELVKQLIYRAEPGKLRRSRFARIRPLTPWRALSQAAAATTVVLTLLWLMGLRPAATWFGSTTEPAARGWLMALFVALTVVVVWSARWLIGDRIVSQVATVGATITLGEKPTTYFDGFLDEIVTFFDAVNPEFVTFEDLDRFDDPQIFDSLRELNTLINESSHWRRKAQSLRFIYAIKDSLFERLGAQTDNQGQRDFSDCKARSTSSEANAGGTATDAGNGGTEADAHAPDLAVAAVERANRTKFFELVIPMVPFISHRNARDHLVGALDHLGFPEDVLSRPLLDLVARHATDMRLLINICNEFAVFTEQLLWTASPAPGLTADDLFALVAYKNFHLADFEAIPQRGSTLDLLERHGRDLVRASIENLQKLTREQIRTEEHRRARDTTAKVLGARLRSLRDVLPAGNGYPYNSFSVGEEKYPDEPVGSTSFWKRVAEVGGLAVTNYSGHRVDLDGENLTRLFPEVADPGWWAPPGEAEMARQRKQLDDDIAFLRGADFDDLARFERFPSWTTTFSDQIKTVLKSELARDLVRRGFINRNYAEYSTTFYGSFVGVDVAFFYNHSVQQNQMYLDYEFKTENAVRNLLEQVPGDFTSTVSAFNIQVAAFLVDERPDEAKRLVALMVADHNADAQTLLDAFLNTANAPRETLIGLLATHPWAGLFNYLVSHRGIPDNESRTCFVDAALLHALPADAYDLDERSRSWLHAYYPQLSAFNRPQPSERTNRIFTFAQEAAIVVFDLNHVATPLRERVVDAQMYEITTSNLRLALGVDGDPAMDEVRKRDSVWEYCRRNLNAYLAAVRGEDPIEHVVQTEAVLIEVITEQHKFWTSDQLRQVLQACAPAATLRDLANVPPETWPALVDASRVLPTVANVSMYVEEIGVDEHLASFLSSNASTPIALQEVDETDKDDRASLAIRILNASGLLSAASRVQLAAGLNLPDYIDATDITPAPDQLLARALEADLVPDTFDTFMHFARAGWGAVSEAFAASASIGEFFSPALLNGFAADLIGSPQVPDTLRRKVVDDLPSYIGDDDAVALEAAGAYARSERIRLPLQEVQRIARATQNPHVVLGQLVQRRDATPDDVIEVLTLLGHPYSELATGPGSEFDLPPGSSSSTLFQRLADAGRVEIVSRGPRGGKRIRVLP